MASRPLARRTLLRGGSGVAMGLPVLSAMSPAVQSAAAESGRQPPKRSVMLSFGLGLLAENLIPNSTGKKYQVSRYLKPADSLRDRYTVISGVSHPGVSGGHRAEASILTATPVGSAGRATNTVSLDQLMAKHLGDATRYPSLILATSGSSSPCYTESGSMIPPTVKPEELFDKLFVDHSKKERAKSARRVSQGRSIMDLVGEDARSLARKLGKGDRNRLADYFNSVRDLEKRMAEAEKWAKRPKPRVDEERPAVGKNPNDAIGRFETMLGLIRLAIATDSTRIVSLHVPGAGGVLPVEGVDQGYHSLSHHGQDEEKLSQLGLVESEFLRLWAEFLLQLDSVEEASGSLLDQTQVFLTSNLGNASNHSNKNMPVLIAGGGIKHGGHLGFDQSNNYPLPNLYVSMLQNMGLPFDEFASSTGTMAGIEVG